MSEEFYDEDGFRLTFEDDTSDQEKQFFMRAFPNVNKISERKVHCTSCYMHIGTAPISEAVIRMHPVLRVTHCRNCHTFYNSGEFDKGEDGSELYCRWCGQGGEVYCCSKCPYVFCKKCIVQNLSRACVQDISRNDNWQCFSCAPKIMWHLRAQHWALSNYIEKQKKDMKDQNMSVQAINNMMKQDNSTCCNNKGLNKKATTPVLNKKGQKRASDAGDQLAPGAAKIPDKRPLPRPIAPQSQVATPPAAKKAKTDNNEVVCTPDIMSMFMNPEEPPPLVATRPAAAAPKPVVPTGGPIPVQNRQVVVRPAIPNAVNPVPMRMPVGNSVAGNSVPPPVYHTINGYRIDLHTAAQQGTYRLPNGKLIQVRKQAPAATPPVTSVPSRNVSIAPKPPNVMYNPVAMAQNPRMSNGGGNVHLNYAIQQQQQLQEQRLQQQRHQQMLQQQRQQQQQQQVTIQPGQPQPTIVAGQPNPALQLPTLALLQSMINGPHEDSPLGRSRKNFEGKLLSGVEICQHIVNKINTLTNSNSFKNIRNVRDLKELYIHVSYLLTYAIGRFKTLQEKCVDDVKKMGFTKESDFVMMGEQISNRNPEEDKSDDEDDCEIIEQNTTLIEIDSEDEDDASKKKKKDGAANAAETEAAVAAILEDNDEANTSGEPISMEDFLQVSFNEVDPSAEKKDDEAAAVTAAAADSSTTEENATESTTPKKDDEDMVELIEVRGDEEAASSAETVQKDSKPSEDAKSAEPAEGADLKDDAAKVEATKSDETTTDGEAKTEEGETKCDAAKVEEKATDAPKAETKDEKEAPAVESPEGEVKKDETESDKPADSMEHDASDADAAKTTVDEPKKDEVDSDKTTVVTEVMEQESEEKSPETVKETAEESQKGEETTAKSTEAADEQSDTTKVAESAETVPESEANVDLEQKMEDETENSESAEVTDGQTEPKSAPESSEPLDKQPDQTDSEDITEKTEECETKSDDVSEIDGEAKTATEPGPSEPVATESKDGQAQDVDLVLISSSESVAEEKTPTEVAAMDVDAVSSEIFEAGSIPNEVKEGPTQTEESPETPVENNDEAIPATEPTEPNTSEEPTEQIGAEDSPEVEQTESNESEAQTVADSTSPPAPEQVQNAQEPEDTPALEPEVPSPTALFAQMEDSLQKVQEIFESTGEAVDEEATEQQQQKIAYDEDAEMAEAASATPTADAEQMEVDGDESTEATPVPVTSEEPQEAPVGTVDTAKSNDDLEDIVSAENFSQEEGGASELPAEETAKKVAGVDGSSEEATAEINGGDC